MNLLQQRLLNGWPLFFVVTAITSSGMMLVLAFIGVSTPEATVEMIRYSVRFSAPWIFIAFATSALVQFFPSELTRWLARNRRYTALSFAAALAWQAVFIAVLLALYSPYYWNVLHKNSELITRIVLYVVLIALAVTSLFPVRRRMRREHWRWLHLVGIWILWLTVWSTYTAQAFGEKPKTIDTVYAVLGTLALAFRITAYFQRLARRPAVS
ncbi:MAG: hypothetical protein AAGI44_10440 [Pseudomonadota bacterium]